MFLAYRIKLPGKFLKDHRCIASVLKCNIVSSCRQKSMQKMFEALCSEVTHLHAGVKHQAGLIQKLMPLSNDTKQGKVQTLQHTLRIYFLFFFDKVTQIFNVYPSEC